MEGQERKSKNKKRKWTPQGIATNMSEGPVMNFLRNFLRCARRRKIPVEKLPEAAQQLAKAGVDISKMPKDDGVRLMSGEKTEGVYNVKTPISNKVFNNEAKLQFNYSKKDDKLDLFCHYKYPHLNLGKLYHGHEWTDEEKKNIIGKGTPGHPIELTFGDNGNKYLCLVAVDSDLNSLTHRNVNNISISDKFCGHVFTDEEKNKLKNGKQLHINDFVTKDGRKYSSYVQYSVAKNGLEIRVPQHKQQVKTKKNLELTQEEKKKIETGEIVEKVFIGKDNLEHVVIVYKNLETGKYESIYPSEYNNMGSILIRPESELLRIAKFSNNEAILNILAKSSSNRVCLEVACNEATSVTTLDGLSKNEDVQVRRAVAKHKKTSSETLDELAFDKDNDVRGYVANNENTKTKTLKNVLAGDYMVDEEALKALEKRGVKKENIVFTTSEYAQGFNTSPAILNKIAEDKTVQPEIRISAIQNNRIPEKTVDKIAKNTDGNDNPNVVAVAIAEQALRKEIKSVIKQSKTKKRGMRL